jgi:hypothetical protein
MDAVPASVGVQAPQERRGRNLQSFQGIILKKHLVYPLKRFAKIGNIRHRIVIVHIPGDIMQVTEYAADKKLTYLLVDQSYATARWLTEMNVKWILSTSTHAIKTGEKIKFPSGR